MQIERIWTGNAYRNFHYLVACPETGEALAIDPLEWHLCWEAARTRGWRITQILNTHEHADHTGGNAGLVAASGAKVLAEFTGAPPSTMYATTPNLYVAVGGSTTWSPQALVLANGQPLAGGQVLWQTTSPGITLAAQTTTTTNSSGIAAGQASVSPQIASNAATLQACLVSTTTCVTFNVVPVHLETAEIHPISGTAQNVPAAQTLSPVVLEATDAIGRPMAGATVTLYETMFAWTPACAESEACPSPPVLGQQTVTAVSASDGTVTLTPMANQGVPVRIVAQATVGPNAVYGFELEQAPSE